MTAHRMILRTVLAVLIAAALVIPLAATTEAATITIVNNDGAGEGFNDPTVVAPVGGNPGVTLGQQRLNVFQRAANIWGTILPSSVTIQVRSQFDAQFCDANSAVLGSAGPMTVHRDFTGVEFGGHWYHQALANRRAGSDLSAPNPDINATFNATLDAGTCLGGATWYYGFDGNEGSNIDLLPVVLHELGHGLGFSTTTNGTTGAYLSSFPSVYDHFIYDLTAGLRWDQMTNGQRVTSAVNSGNLIWIGDAVKVFAPTRLEKRTRFNVNTPGGIAGLKSHLVAEFSGNITQGGVTQDVVIANDGVATTSDGCQSFVNAAQIAGKIAFVDRGNCNFITKATNAVAAGAAGLVVADNGSGVVVMTGSPNVTIPCLMIGQADATAIRNNLPVNATINRDATRLQGADDNDRVLLYAPNPFEGGSSVSHWDVSATPSLLMEPFISDALSDSVDLTLQHCDDIGWFIPHTTATTLALFTAESRAEGILLRWQFADPSEIASLVVERTQAEDGPWSPAEVDLGADGAVTTALDRHVEAGARYYYRLSTLDHDGHAHVFGPIVATRVATPRAALGMPAPNPMTASAAVSFRIGQPEYVRLWVIDARGRKVATLQEGMMAPGDYSRSWDGRSDRRIQAAPGIYFVTLKTSRDFETRRLTLIR